MLKFLTKTTPFLLASLLVATSGFAQDYTKGQKKGFDQGLEMPASQTLAAHSYPARQEVRGSWDIQTNVSYILWQAIQDNMEIGIFCNSANPSQENSVSRVKRADFEYKSGFKVGLGLNLDYDNWNVHSEYTWFHGKTHARVASESGQTLFGAKGVFISNGDTNPTFASADQNWHLKADFVDLSLARSYYSGTKLTFNPFLGVRGSWLRQGHKTTYRKDSNYLTVDAKTVSQGIGPRTGVDSNWLLGYGFRITGKAAADILFTRYESALNQTSTTLPNNTKISDRHNGFLKAHSDLELGLGWGSYFDNNNWYVDLSADYGFQTFWGQNMFRNFGDTVGKMSNPNGDLSIHGLTITARIDY